MTEHFKFVKLSAAPTTTSWSQAYSAGKLCAVLSLTMPSTEELSLSMIGKDALTTLEQEFFTLEQKDLPSIQKAVTLASEKIPSHVSKVLIVGAIQDNILYVYVLGDGKVLLFRNSSLGKVAGDHADLEGIHSFSGFVQENDKVVFATRSFLTQVSESELSEILPKPLDEVGDFLAAKLETALEHSGQEAACVLSYVSVDAAFLTEPLTPSFDDEESENHAPPSESLKKRHFSFPKINATPLFIRKKITLVACALILLLILSFLLIRGYQKQQNAKQQALFDSVYPQAKKNYDEGESLLSLNKNLAHESFVAAEKVLNENRGKFVNSSPQGKQIVELQSLVENALSATSTQKETAATQTTFDKSDLLRIEKGSGNVLFASVDSNNVYILTRVSVISQDRKSSNAKTIIKNDNSWNDVGGFGAYLGNVYILDRNSGVVKFIAGDNGYGKTSYFTSGVNPNLSKAAAMAIDGSLYILTSDGTIAKFTRGKPDQFNEKGIDKNLSGAIRLFTNENEDNLYVLDKANSRIVVLSKDGTFKNEYTAAVIKDASDFEVSESDKKIYLLSKGSIYQISL